MRVDLQKPDTWHAVNQVYRDALGLGDGRYSVQAYMSLKQALWEICMQLAQLQPNKRTVVYLKEAAPLFEPVAVHLSREGFKVKALSESEMNAPSTWFEGVEKDLLFCVHSSDDPVTGELFALPELDLALKDKRVYRISVSHSKHSCIPVLKPAPLETQILSLGPSRALAILGERVKLTPPVAAGLQWPEISLETAGRELTRFSEIEYREMKSRVQALEAALPVGAENILQPDRDRLFDRAIFAYRDVDGLSLITELAKILNVSLGPPGGNGPLETTSLCRWQDERVLQALTARGFAPEILRGLVIVASHLLTESTRETVENAHARLVKQQTG